MEGKERGTNGCESKAHRNGKVHADGIAGRMGNLYADDCAALRSVGGADTKRKNRLGGNGLWRDRHSPGGFLCGLRGVLQTDHASEAAGVHSLRHHLSMFPGCHYGTSVWRKI